MRPLGTYTGRGSNIGRALLVRRGLADLAAAIGPRNDVLQAADADGLRHESALTAVRSLMRAFVVSDVWRAMRPADRWQISEFERSLRDQPSGAARLTCEGMAKYLESLSSINQREVLLLHDHRRIRELREALDSARQFRDISRHAFVEMVRKGYSAALELYGRHPVTDPMIQKLARTPVDSVTDEHLAALFDQLDTILAATGT